MLLQNDISIEIVKKLSVKIFGRPFHQQGAIIIHGVP